MRGLEAYHVAAMVSAPEGEDGTKVREHHHRMACALRELAGEIVSRAIAADEIEKTLGVSDGDVDGDPEDEI